MIKHAARFQIYVLKEDATRQQLTTRKMSFTDTNLTSVITFIDTC